MRSNDYLTELIDLIDRELIDFPIIEQEEYNDFLDKIKDRMGGKCIKTKFAK